MKRTLLFNPGPATTSLAVKQAQIVPDICPREADFGALIGSIRHRLVLLAHGNDKDHTAVLFTASGTGAVEAALSGLTDHKTHFLVLQNGAYGQRLRSILSAYHIPHQVWDVPEGTVPSPADFERQLLLHPGITHVAAVHHETSTGLLNPVRDFATICRLRSIHLVVDAMSSFGVEPLSMQDDGFAAIVSSSNKCIQGMPGMAFVITKKSLIENSVQRTGSFYLNLRDQFHALDHQHQFRFTPPVQTLYAFDTALDELEIETPAGRRARYHANWHRMVAGLAGLGLKTEYSFEHQSQILAVFSEPDWPGFSFLGMHDYLYEHGITIYPGKLSNKPTFRLSVLGDLHAVDIDTLIAKVRLYKQYLG